MTGFRCGRLSCYASRRSTSCSIRASQRIEPESHTVLLDDGSSREFGALLLATGAEPMRAAHSPARETTEVRHLRTFADSRAIVARAEIGETCRRRRRELHRARSRALRCAREAST